MSREILVDTLEALAPTLAALANTRGGSRAVVQLQGYSKGAHETAEMLDEVLQAVLKITPRLIIPLPKVIEHKHRPAIQVEIPPGLPHVYALDGRYLVWSDIRKAEEPLTPQDLRRLLVERGETQFESEPVTGATLNDLDWEQVRVYVARLGMGTDRDSLQRCLMRRGCLVQDPETPYLLDSLRPTNAGLLLFGRDVQSRLRGADITAVRFAGEAMSDTFSRQDIIGTLPEQIKRAETFLRDHLRKIQRLKATMQRLESYEYPLEAARELVVNAVAHRDYSITGDGIRLYLFHNRMEITSPGRLAGPVTISNIADERFSRNPIIVQVLSDMGYIERLGYGVDRVLELMRQQDLPEPTFQETDGGFRVTLYNRLPHSAHYDDDDWLEDRRRAYSGYDPAPTTVEVAVTTASLLNLAPEVVEQHLAEYREMGVALNPRQETAIVYLKQPQNTRITNGDLQRLYGIHQETIRRDLSDLVARNLLSKMGEKRGAYYVLRSDWVLYVTATPSATAQSETETPNV